MRCEGADNPPCRRCRTTGLECLFEKPSREATLTGEAGLECVSPASNPSVTHAVCRRIRSLEAHVAEIRQTQTTISNTLQELLHHVRGGGLPARSPSTYPSSFHQSPSLNSPAISTPTASNQHASPPSGSTPFPPRQQHRGTMSNAYPSSSHSLPPDDPHSSQLSPMYGSYPGGHNYNTPSQHSQGPTLPPFSSISIMGPPSQQSNVSSVRYQSSDPNYPRSSGKYQSGSKRQASSNVTSADSSDVEDDDNGELPSHGLVAPWEVLRGLADVAIDRASKVGAFHIRAPHHLYPRLSER